MPLFAAIQLNCLHWRKRPWQPSWDHGQPYCPSADVATGVPKSTGGDKAFIMEFFLGLKPEMAVEDGHGRPLRFVAVHEVHSLCMFFLTLPRDK